MKQPLESLPSAIQTAFERSLEHISFSIREHEYMFIADYSEAPIIQGMLFVADDEAETWWAIADTGEEYIGDEDDPPEPWRGLPIWMAEKVADRSIHSIN
jgi:hypothetical protein